MLKDGAEPGLEVPALMEGGEHDLHLIRGEPIEKSHRGVQFRKPRIPLGDWDAANWDANGLGPIPDICRQRRPESQKDYDPLLRSWINCTWIGTRSLITWKSTCNSTTLRANQSRGMDERIPKRYASDRSSPDGVTKYAALS